MSLHLLKQKNIVILALVLKKLRITRNCFNQIPFTLHLEKKKKNENYFTLICLHFIPFFLFIFNSSLKKIKLIKITNYLKERETFKN